MSKDRGEGVSPWGRQPPYLPIVLPFSNTDIHPLSYIYIQLISHSILTGVAFCVYAVRCFVRIIERIRRVFVVFS